jgi:hypothetical protein
MNQLGVIMKMQGLQNEMQANRLQAQKYQQETATSQATERKTRLEAKRAAFERGAAMAGDNPELLMGLLTKASQDPDLSEVLGIGPQHLQFIGSQLNDPTKVKMLANRMRGMTAKEEADLAKPPTTLGQLQMARDQLDRNDPMYPTKLDEINNQIKYEQTRPAGTSISLNTGTEKKYGEEFGRNVATQDSEMLSAARAAPKLAQSAVDIMAALNSPGLISGAGADIRLSLAKALDLAGNTPDAGIANTEALISSMGQSTLNSIKSSGLGSGQGFTDKDLVFLQTAAGGKINMSLENIRRLADLQYRAAQQSVSAWDSRRKTLPAGILADTGLSNETYTLPPPVPSGGAAPATAPAAAAAPATAPAAADASSIPEGQTATSADGKTRIIFRGGQWHLMQ